MALRDQPYLPLYVQDFLTDEKLNECSALACGVYIKLMCLMHKSEEYGTILLRQKDKQTTCQITNFATKLVKHLPYPPEDIIKGIIELTTEGCLKIEGDKLLQKRMISDNEISLIRKESGSKGGFAKAKKIANDVAKGIANTEDEYEIENATVNVLVLNEDRFLDFWNLYDKKVRKPAVQKQWNKLTEAEKQKVLDVTPSYVNSKPEKQFRLDPERFLKYKSFNDEIIEAKNGTDRKNGGASPNELAAIVARRFEREKNGN